MSPRRGTKPRINGMRIEFSQVKSPQKWRELLARRENASTKNLRGKMRAVSMSGEELHRMGLAITSFEGPNGTHGRHVVKLSHIGPHKSSAEHFGKAYARIFHLTHRHASGSIRLQNNSVLGILEDVSYGQRVRHHSKFSEPHSFDRLVRYAKTDTYDNESNLHQLVQHILAYFPSEKEYHGALESMLRDGRMAVHLRKLNEITFDERDRHRFPQDEAEQMKKPLIAVIQYLGRHAMRSARVRKAKIQ